MMIKPRSYGTNTLLWGGLYFIMVLWAGQGAALATQAPLLSDLDIPLMADFREEENSRVVFDSPEGRLVEVRATGPHGVQKTYDYYQIVLPSLSWRIGGDGSKMIGCAGLGTKCILAQRDKEILILKISGISKLEGQSEDKTVILFSVSPE